MAQDPIYPVSPAELLRDLVESLVDKDFVPHVVIGPLSEQQKLDGAVQLATAGNAGEESYLPLIRPRVQLRCIAPALADSERMARHIYQQIHGLGRTVVVQRSTGDRYLIHWIRVTGGPSDHFDTSETWEGLMFADTMIGTTPVPDGL